MSVRSHRSLYYAACMLLALTLAACSQVRAPGPGGGGGDDPLIGSFAVTPTSGNAPLSVVLSWEVAGVEGLLCTLSFGDGSPDLVMEDCVSDDLAHVYQTPGNRVAGLTVNDNGERSAVRHVVVVVHDPGGPGGNTAPTIDDFTATPDEGERPHDTTFEWSISDVDGDILNCTIRFGDGSPAQHFLPCDSDDSVSHLYPDAGVFTATLIVTDGQGGASQATTAVVVTEGGTPGPSNQPPTIGDLYADPGSGPAPFTTTIGWSASDPDGDTLSCEVVFGDGSSEHLAPCAEIGNTSHTYTTPGIYTVHLVVEDGQGGSATGEVVIIATDPGSDNPPVIQDFGATPESGELPLTVVFDWTVSDPDGGQLSCVLVPGDGSDPIHIADCQVVSTQSATYLTEGVFEATLAVVDGDGNVVVSDPIVISVEPVPPTLASVRAGPRLASLDTSRSALLGPLVGGLLDGGVGLELLDWDGLASIQINLLDFLNALALEVDVATPAQALDTDVNLFDILDALIAVVDEAGDTLLALELGDLRSALPIGLDSGLLRLIDLFDLDLANRLLEDAVLDLLDLLLGSVQLFNLEHAANTPSPITLSLAGLGLDGVLDEVSVQLRVIEPPVIIINQAGATFHSAAIRLKLDVDLIDLDTASLPGLLGLISGLLDVLEILVDLDASLTVSQFGLYLEIGSAEGALSAIDELVGAVQLEATPSLVGLHLGQIDDAVFFDRNASIQPEDIEFGVIGALDLSLSVLGILPAGTASINIGLKASASAEAPLGGSLSFAGPFPQTQVVGSSVAAVPALITSLLGDLELEATVGSASAGLLGFLSVLVVEVVDVVLPVVESLLAPLPLGDLLGPVVDPLLDLLGLRVGEVEITVLELLLP